MADSTERQEGSVHENSLILISKTDRIKNSEKEKMAKGHMQNKPEALTITITKTPCKHILPTGVRVQGGKC